MSQPSLRVAAVQLQSDDDVSRNLQRVEFWVEQAARSGAELILLPENFAYFGNEVDKAGHAEAFDAGPASDGPILRALRVLSQRHQVWLIAGGLPERSADAARPYNTSLVLDRAGQVVTRYRKLHLFDVELPDGRAMRESAGTSAGQELAVLGVQGVNIGLSICYDVRFAALFAALVARGAQVLTVPAAFTEQTGKDHWHVLLRARAIEFQCWVVAAGQWGQHPGGRRTYGHSMIVDPWGVVVSECSNREGFALATLDLGLVNEVRSKIPCLAHQRDVY